MILDPNPILKTAYLYSGLEEGSEICSWNCGFTGRLVIYWLSVHQQAYAGKGDTTYLCTYPSLKFHFIYFLATAYPVFSSPYLIKCNLCRYWTVKKGTATSHSETIKLHTRVSRDERWLQLTSSYSLYRLSRIYVWGLFYHIPHWVYVLFSFTYY
jgi:hypothetical protein